MTSDITAFVLARAAERERAALSALSGTGDPEDVPAWRRETRWHSNYERVIALRSDVPEEHLARARTTRPGVDLRCELVATATVANDAVAFHIASNDPARVLREVAAVRALASGHVHIAHAIPGEPGACACLDEMDQRNAWPCPTMRALASIDSDHPDHDPSWDLT